MTVQTHNFSAVILAGGQARRMGGTDKGLLRLNGKAMIEHVIEALEPQCDSIVINANRNHDEYRKFNCPVVADLDKDFNGPLAGMAACMQACSSEFILTLPCDSPVVAADYVERMFKVQSDTSAEICVARDADRLQPVFCLIDCQLLDSMLSYLASGQRKIDRWFSQHSLAEVDFSDHQQMFNNINTPDDLKNMEKELLRETA